MKRVAVALLLLSLPSAVLAADAAAGQKLFDTRCKACHGAAGAGGVMCKASIAGKSEAETKAAVQNGKGKMKPLASVTGEALVNVAAYVASLKK